VYDRRLSVALVVDLSKPEELWLTVERWLDVVKARVAAVYRGTDNTDPSLKDTLHQSAWQRVGEEHEVALASSGLELTLLVCRMSDVSVL